MAGVLLGLVFVWIQSRRVRTRRVRTRICMRTGHDDVKPSHGAGPYHAPESTITMIMNIIYAMSLSVILLLFNMNMILNMNIEYTYR